MHRLLALMVVLPMLGLGHAPLATADSPSARESDALAAVDRQVDGAVLFTRKGRIWKVVIGEWSPTELGRGSYARWSPDGKHVAVLDGRTLYVMSADGSERRKLADGVRSGDPSPIEFHRNGREVLYPDGKRGLVAVDIDTGKSRDLGAKLLGELGMSRHADRVVGRVGHDLFAYDLAAGRHRKFAKGCSPGVSPDGNWLMCNVGGHKALALQSWDGKKRMQLSAKTAQPDGKWDNHHWSNHNDWIAAQGDGKRREIYLLQVSADHATRVTFTGGCAYPDLFVDAAGAAGAVASSVEDNADVSADTAADWPLDRENLLFAWENAAATNTVKRAGDDTVVCQFTARGHARPGRFHDWLLSGGHAVSNADAGFAKAVNKAGALTLEAMLTPTAAELADGKPATALALTDAQGNADLGVMQRGGFWEIILGHHKHDVRFARVKADRPVHLAVVLQGDRLDVHLDGRAVVRNRKVDGQLTARFDRIQLGDTDGRWSGRAEAVALYARAMSPRDVAATNRRHETAIANRKPLTPLVVRVKRVETTPLPDASDLRDYARGLVFHSYDVLEVKHGQLDAKRIVIAHWALLDRKPVAPVQRFEVGQTETFTLSPLDAQPQLEGERQFYEITELDAPQFFDVLTPGR